MKQRMFCTSTLAGFVVFSAFTGFTTFNPALAQTGAPSGQATQTTSTAAPSLAEGEVRKIDLETGKITIRHGDIKHLDMPPMTMVFVAKDKALLDKTSVGAKILFMASQDNGQMVVTDIQPKK